MTHLEDLLFPVEKIENEANTNSEYSWKVVAEIEGVEKTLNYCSPRFNLLKNEDVFPVVESMLEQAGAEFEKAYKMNADMTTFHAVYIIRKIHGVDVGINVGGNDVIYPTFIVDNSYNGMTQGSGTFGYFRMICSNGLVIPLEGQEKNNYAFKGKHTKKLSFSFDQLLGKLNSFIENQNIYKRRIEVLTDRKIENYADRVEAVLEATKVSASKAQLETIKQTIAKEAEALDTEVSDWLIYNGINAHIFKGVNSKGEKRSALPEVKRSQDQKVLQYIMRNEPVLAEN